VEPALTGPPLKNLPDNTTMHDLIVLTELGLAFRVGLFGSAKGGHTVDSEEPGPKREGRPESAA